MMKRTFHNSFEKSISTMPDGTPEDDDEFGVIGEPTPAPEGDSNDSETDQEKSEHPILSSPRESDRPMADSQQSPPSGFEMEETSQQGKPVERSDDTSEKESEIAPTEENPERALSIFTPLDTTHWKEESMREVCWAVPKTIGRAAYLALFFLAAITVFLPIFDIGANEPALLMTVAVRGALYAGVGAGLYFLGKLARKVIYNLDPGQLRKASMLSLLAKAAIYFSLSALLLGFGLTSGFTIQAFAGQSWSYAFFLAVGAIAVVLPPYLGVKRIRKTLLFLRGELPQQGTA